MSELVLHDYWRSSASYRLRIALALKGLSYTHQTYDLRQGAHLEGPFAMLSPQRLVPALETEDGVLVQSLAIIEWLEERYPEPPLLPPDPAGRAIVRAMSQAIACDIHPLNNLRVLNALRADFAASPAQIDLWIHRWVGEGFTALELMVSRHGGQYCFGDDVSFADCCLVPQLYAARRFKVDLSEYPRLIAIEQRVQDLPGVAGAAPEQQPDSDTPG